MQKIIELRLEILDKKLNRMSRVILGVFEANLLASFPKLQRILNFLSLRNLLSNEIFFAILHNYFFNSLFSYTEITKNMI